MQKLWRTPTRGYLIAFVAGMVTATVLFRLSRNVADPKIVHRPKLAPTSSVRTLPVHEDLALVNPQQVPEPPSIDRNSVPDRKVKDELMAEHKTFLHGRYIASSKLVGRVFSRDVSKEVITQVTTSVVHSFSPAVENHAKEMFADEHGECLIYATIPAMIKDDDGQILVTQRLWMGQYEKKKTKLKKLGKPLSDLDKDWKNTWQENYFYHQVLTGDYKETGPGRILGIPSPTNLMYLYKSDGPMDPRYILVDEEIFLLFHSWGNDKLSGDTAAGRVYLWNWSKNTKKKLNPHVTLMRTEINWIPLEKDGQLYLTYSLDPLRVMKCDTTTADCQFVHLQEPLDKFKFTYTGDHLRGGTPFLLYKYPYYIGIGHSVSVTKRDFAVYNVNLIVLCVEPWRIVYVSDHLGLSNDFLRLTPIKREFTILHHFFYPMGLLIQSLDVIDVSGNLNDINGHVVRISGVANLMEKIMASDQQQQGVDLESPRTKAIQEYVIGRSQLKYPNDTFYTE